MSTLTPTPGQTVGPFFHFALPYAGDRELVSPGTPGAVQLHGTVYDGAGAPISDALVEIWQAAPDGAVVARAGSLCRDGATFTGFGRAPTRRDGTYSFWTLVPGPTEEGAAAFFAVTVLARGLTNRLFTRAYVPGDTSVLAADRLLASVEDDRRATLLAVEDEQGLRFDIRLQGDDETVFLQFPGH
ncbi:protocatechuate 3,4-dioxygenase subunit alpha [Mumia sp. zg.B53]|uniref:protocatechuate 3,4-dioxygenase subunit alpha n=1 Tax=unclassified Mumia TaxID=2621872 RepID=UPI001C6E8D74|nr:MULTISPECIES: protocatechuate 3,4-dioxygenase subunit alpha [unclassified Mumia]MBW9207609.1 protocatechuate 3,4-dioxygenase subunit alpha [Mumia sp. zg.B17]MBW9210045.1 protocatechuate 3,4-dioxygenase subunit alpha [Mumia sp. zg.B21]MBW9214649.1 protocatechuate 3,4-dioxygenase subunit alpha [Mumia sp. zg.B53]MDD9348469.1 protocatechuate 3,4-dioxygenase subunit alpha [Mumia sp.]